MLLMLPVGVVRRVCQDISIGFVLIVQFSEFLKVRRRVNGELVLFEGLIRFIMGDSR